MDLNSESQPVDSLALQLSSAHSLWQVPVGIFGETGQGAGQLEVIRVRTGVVCEQVGPGVNPVRGEAPDAGGLGEGAVGAEGLMERGLVDVDISKSLLQLLMRGGVVTEPGGGHAGRQGVVLVGGGGGAGPGLADAGGHGHRQRGRVGGTGEEGTVG